MISIFIEHFYNNNHLLSHVNLCLLSILKNDILDDVDEEDDDHVPDDAAKEGDGDNIDEL